MTMESADAKKQMDGQRPQFKKISDGPTIEFIESLLSPSVEASTHNQTVADDEEENLQIPTVVDGTPRDQNDVPDEQKLYDSTVVNDTSSDQNDGPVPGDQKPYSPTVVSGTPSDQNDGPVPGDQKPYSPTVVGGRPSDQNDIPGDQKSYDPNDLGSTQRDQNDIHVPGAPKPYSPTVVDGRPSGQNDIHVPGDQKPYSPTVVGGRPSDQNDIPGDQKPYSPTVVGGTPRNQNDIPGAPKPYSPTVIGGTPRDQKPYDQTALDDIAGDKKSCDQTVANKVSGNPKQDNQTDDGMDDDDYDDDEDAHNDGMCSSVPKQRKIFQEEVKTLKSSEPLFATFKEKTGLLPPGSFQTNVQLPKRSPPERWVSKRGSLTENQHFSKILAPDNYSWAYSQRENLGRNSDAEIIFDPEIGTSIITGLHSYSSNSVANPYTDIDLKDPDSRVVNEPLERQRKEENNVIDLGYKREPSLNYAADSNWSNSLKEFDGIPNVEVHNVANDGNCMFRAIEDQLHMQKDYTFTHADLRQKAVEYLQNNPILDGGTHLKNFLSESNPSWEDYLRKMSKVGEWGDEIMLRALSKLLQRTIVVHSKKGREPIHKTEIEHSENKGCIVLGHIGEVHYVSLRQRNWRKSFISDKNKTPVESKSRNHDKEGKYVDAKSGVSLPHLNLMIQMFMSPLDSDILKSHVQQRLSIIAKEISQRTQPINFAIYGHSSNLINCDLKYLFWTMIIGGNYFPNILESDYVYIFPEKYVVTGNCECSLTSEKIVFIDEEEKNIHKGFTRLKPWGRSTQCDLVDFEIIAGKYYLRSDLMLMADNKFDMNAISLDHWPNCAQEWIRRHRPSGWPDQETIQRIIKANKCFVIPVSHSRSVNSSIEFKYCFGYVEKELFHSISHEQRIVCLVLNMLLRFCIGDLLDAQDLFEFLKIVFLKTLEKIDQETWSEKSGEVFLHMLDFFIQSLNQRKLPDYFIPLNNVLDNVSPDRLFQVESLLSNIRPEIADFILLMATEEIHAPIDELKQIYHDMALFLETKDTLHFQREVGIKVMCDWAEKCQYGDSCVGQRVVVSLSKALDQIVKTYPPLR